MKYLAIFRNPYVIAILDLLRPVWAIDYVMKLMNWDRETYMPSNALKDRILVIDELTLMKHKILLSKELEKLVVKALESYDELNDFERGLLRVLSRDIKFMKAVPLKILRELNKIRYEARRVWYLARAKQDYNVFKPYLERMIYIQSLIADYLGYKKHPYDALLDLYEEGANTSLLDSVAIELLNEFTKLLKKVLDTEFTRPHKLCELRYDKSSMKSLITELLTKLGLPLGSKSRIDFSSNLFMVPLGSNDVRLIIRVEDRDLRSQILNAIHEFGHAIYELLIDEKIHYTPLAVGASISIHEGIARFWSSVIGRSKCFIAWVRDLLIKYVSELCNYTVNDLFTYFNQVVISPIRVGSDELTHNIHIIIRYDIEKKLIGGELSTDELPSYWCERYEKLLGIKPKNHNEGVLQEVHWALGYFGYLPTYLLGSIIATQIKFNFEKEKGSVCNYVNNGRFDVLINYLKDRICRWGAVYSPKELIKKAFNEGLNHKYLIDYLRQKYLST